MTHMLTATGADYHFTGYHAHHDAGRPVRIRDIAHQLSMINRFHGATSRPYSVAEHSLLVSQIIEKQGHSASVQLAGLMHDAHEIYTQDLASPAKTAVNRASTQAGGTQAWSYFENEHAQRVRRHFCLLTVFTSARAIIHRADLQALATERRDLLPFDRYMHAPWLVLGDGEVDPELVVHPIEWVSLKTPERERQAWYDWRLAFQNRFDRLSGALGLDLAEGVAA